MGRSGYADISKTTAIRWRCQTMIQVRFGPAQETQVEFLCKTCLLQS